MRRSRDEMEEGPVPEWIAHPDLPTNVKTARLNNGVDTFYYTRPYNKRKQSGLKKTPGQAGEFLDLWVETKYIRVGQNFPNTRRRAAVVERRNVYKNPIEMALASMVAKNAELVKKIDEAGECIDSSIERQRTRKRPGGSRPETNRRGWLDWHFSPLASPP